MPLVLVHGVPDTERVWNALRARLDRTDVVTVSLPGFGCPRPAGFAATKEAYVDWLLGELSALKGPLDIVGHDWGALLVVRSLCLQPRLARTWAAGAAPVDPDYVWHDTAKMWQTPGLGEQMMELATPEAMQGGLEGAGVPAAEAAETARHVDDTMKQCILSLYRSAVNVGAEWKDDLGRIASPGLVLWGENDPFATPDFGARLAQRTGSRFISYAGCGHWWQLERPAEVAADLKGLWSAV